MKSKPSIKLKILKLFVLLFALLVLAFQFAFIYISNTDPEWSAKASRAWENKDISKELLDGAIEDEVKNKPIYFRQRNIQAKVDDPLTFKLYSDENTPDTKLPGFISLNGRDMTINPVNKDLGEYEFSVKSEDEEARFIYTFKVKVELPPVDFAKLEKDVEAILGNQKPHYAVYVYDLKREQSFGINEEEIFAPGSTSKLPYAIIALRDVDKGRYSRSYVDPILTKLIIHGSNTAMMELESMLGGNSAYNARVRNELKVDNIFRYPHNVQASDLGRLYIGIYHQEYLSKSSNDFLLYLLLNTGPSYDNRIKQGLPKDKGVKFAHKTGWVTTAPSGEAYNDSGIVYGEETDYVIVVLDKNIDRNAAIVMMKPISEKVYKALNGK